MKNGYAMIKWGMALATAFWLAFPAMAAQGASANYSAPPGLFSNGGGQGSSANYQQAGVLGYSFAQVNSGSANYQGGLAIGAVLPVTLGLNPSILTFTSQNVGTSSTMQAVTLTNTGSGVLNIGSIAASGDFGQSNGCGATLAAGANCTISVTFTPTAAGARNGSLSITSNAATSHSAISLSGTGVAVPTVALNFSARWNLVGNSVNTPLAVVTTFGDASKVQTVWKWLPATSKWAFYTPLQTDGGAAYAATKGYDVLTTINGGEGYWVNAKTAFTAQLPTGTSVGASYFQNQLDPTLNKLAKGWNLVATGDSITPSAFNQALSLTPPAQGVIPLNVTTLWAWDNTLSNWYFYAPSLEANGGLASYITSKSYLDFTQHSKTLGQGVGFWVNKP